MKIEIPNLDKDPTGKTWLIQTKLQELGFDPGPIDNWPGKKTQDALDAFREAIGSGSPVNLQDSKASSFADPADLRAFQKCKGAGHSDQFCFKTGDNGIGNGRLGGYNTAQLDTPMCALHKDWIEEKFGSVEGGKDQKVLVVVASEGVERSVVCLLADTCGVKSRVDLNPAAAKALLLNPPFLVKAKWGWIEEIAPEPIETPEQIAPEPIETPEQ